MKPQINHIAKKEQHPEPKKHPFPQKKKRVKPVAKRELPTDIQSGIRET